MCSKLDITVKVTIPKTVLQSSAGCTLWLKVETAFSFFFFLFFFFFFFLSCGLSDGDLVVSFICFIRNCWNHSQCLWVLWLKYCVDWITKMILLGLGYKTPQIFFYGCGNFKFWTQWLSYNWVLISSLVGFQHRSDVDQIPVNVISFFDTVEFEFKVEYS